MKRYYLLMAISMMLALPVSLLAENDCDAISLKKGIQTQLDLLDEEPVGALLGILELAITGLHECSVDQYSFSGLPGAQPVLGPLSLSESYYIFTMTTDGSAKVEGVALDGCGKELGGAIYNVSASQAIHGAENLVKVASECISYLEISKITSAWTLTIEKLR